MRTFTRTVRGALMFAVAGLFVVSVTSCDLLMALLEEGIETGVTIEERIEQFRQSLNEEDRAYIAENHFHPYMQNYGQLAQDTTLTTGPLSYDNAPFVFEEPEIETSGTVETATVQFENFYGATGEMVFTMETDGLDYKIRRLVLTLDAQPTIEYELKIVDMRNQ